MSPPRLVAAAVIGLAVALLLASSRERADGHGHAGDVQFGLASYYGPGFHGELTASGERFDQNAMVAAHRTLPFGTRVRVTNLENNRRVVLRIVDRGPFGRNFKQGTIIDVSKGAATRLDFLEDGLVRVRVDVLERRWWLFGRR